MKKSILDLGKVLNKAEQKNINGGGHPGGGNCGNSYYNRCMNYCVQDDYPWVCDIQCRHLMSPPC